MFAPRRRVGAGSNRNNLGLVLLAIQLVQFGVDRVPVVTLTTILLNVGIFVHIPEMLEVKMPGVGDICVSYYGVVVYKEYIRLILSGFYHLSDMHLYYNMVSLLYKGSQLEPRLGSPKFGIIMGVLLGLSNVVYCALQYLISTATQDTSSLRTCAAGFSAVLFGLKVVLQNNSPPSHRLLGIPIHLAYWSELVWISIIAPQVSFVGHLSGIIAGLLLTQGPLKFVLTGQIPVFFNTSPSNTQRGAGVTTGRSGPTNWGSGTTRGANRPDDSEDADIQEAIRRSLNDPLQPRYDTGPSGYTPYNNGYNDSSSYHSNYNGGYHDNYNRGYHDNYNDNQSGSSRLYPTIPSAPPEEQAPFPDGIPPSLPLSHEEIRRRRVQRFE